MFSSFIFSGSSIDTVWIDSSISKMNWIGYKVTGSHDGHIKIDEGYVLKKNNLIVGGEIVVNMESITVDDIKDVKSNAKRTLTNKTNSTVRLGVPAIFDQKNIYKLEKIL